MCCENCGLHLDTVAEGKKEAEQEIWADELSDIEDLLESVAEERSKMSVEKEDLQELKKDASSHAEVF